MRSIYISLFAAVILMCAGKVMAVEMPDLAKKNRCSACHAIDKKIVGPAWMDVSKFYNGKMEKTTNGKTLKEATGGKAPADWLLYKVSNGGSGNWGTASMDMPNDPIGKRQEEIKVLIKFVLDLAK